MLKEKCPRKSFAFSSNAGPQKASLSSRKSTKKLSLAATLRALFRLRLAFRMVFYNDLKKEVKSLRREKKDAFAVRTSAESDAFLCARSLRRGKRRFPSRLRRRFFSS
jgi:hypothetical protein